MVQVGMQSRSIGYKRRAIELLRDGAIGKVYYAKGLCFKRRPSIGHADDEPTPPGLNWDIFLGPAPKRPYNLLRFKYNWHWFWDTGNGDIGNQGIHEMDVARWGLGRGLPKSVVSTGGKYVYEDDQETPNTQIATFDYGDAELVFEVRGLNTGGEASIAAGGANFVGNIFLGSKGYMSLDHQGFQIYLGDKREPGEGSKGADKGDTKSHMTNFLDWRESIVAWEPIDAQTTKVMWTLNYRRGLDPAWYFGPMERYAVRLAAGYLIETVATP